MGLWKTVYMNILTNIIGLQVITHFTEGHTFVSLFSKFSMAGRFEKKYIDIMTLRVMVTKIKNGNADPDWG